MWVNIFACVLCVVMVLHDDDDVTDLAIIRGSLSVPAWAGGNGQTLPAFFQLE